MPDMALAPQTAVLRVTTHLDAEIFLIGNERLVIARAVHQLETTQPRGLYRIKITRASAAVERLLDLYDDLSLDIQVPGLDTVVPFQRTMPAAAQRQIERLVELAVEDPAANLMIIGRSPLSAQTAADNPDALAPSPLAGVRIVPWTSNGDPQDLIKAEDKAKQQLIENENWAIRCCKMQPAICVLEIEDGHRVMRQSIVLSPNWQTRVFIRRQIASEVVRSEAARNLLEVAVHMSDPGWPIALASDFESSEVARLALAMGSLIVVSPTILNVFLGEKFTDPVAGLAAAHLMFDAFEWSASKSSSMGDIAPPDLSSLRNVAGTVIDNLSGLFSGRLPDLVALKLRASLPLLDSEKAIVAPPVYARSWRALIGASTGPSPKVHIDTKLFARCAANFTSGAYFAWTPTSMADFIQELVASNQNSLRQLAGVAAAPAAPPAPKISTVRVNVRDHIAKTFGADRSRLRPTTDITKRFQIDLPGLHNLAGSINQTDWMKALPSQLELDDVKNVTTIGDLANSIMNKVMLPSEAVPPQPDREAGPENPSGVFATILAAEPSRSRLADELGIPRSVLESFATDVSSPTATADTNPTTDSSTSQGN